MQLEWALPHTKYERVLFLAGQRLWRKSFEHKALEMSCGIETRQPKHFCAESRTSPETVSVVELNKEVQAMLQGPHMVFNEMKRLRKRLS